MACTSLDTIPFTSPFWFDANMMSPISELYASLRVVSVSTCEIEQLKYAEYSNLFFKVCVCSRLVEGSLKTKLFAQKSARQSISMQSIERFSVHAKCVIGREKTSMAFRICALTEFLVRRNSVCHFSDQSTAMQSMKPIAFIACTKPMVFFLLICEALRNKYNVNMIGMYSFFSFVRSFERSSCSFALCISLT